MARTTVQLPDEVMTRLKVIADANGTTVSVLVRGAIDRLIEEYEGEHLSQIIAVLEGPPILGERHEEDALAELSFGHSGSGESAR